MLGVLSKTHRLAQRLRATASPSHLVKVEELAHGEQVGLDELPAPLPIGQGSV